MFTAKFGNQSIKELGPHKVIDIRNPLPILDLLTETLDLTNSVLNFMFHIGLVRAWICQCLENKACTC
ncbi:hypothetical protein RRF57_005201 [Xylaria bambusicola]|uniref:Uncharacterized protein n=1 Tax=Xylaria bambusicola TaxID=326684 RepID=A0AAN7UQ41_9PEZI